MACFVQLFVVRRGSCIRVGPFVNSRNMAKFTNYLYDPTDPDTPSRVQRDIPEFQLHCPDITKLILYTIYVYDPHADLLKLFPTDFNRRKREAALKAGFTFNNEDTFDIWVEDCIVGANDNYNSAIVTFVTRFNISDLPSYVMYRQVFFSEFSAAMGAKDSKEKKAAMDNAEVARKQLQELEKKLFTDEETINVRNALYVLAERHKLNLRPEDKAKEIETKTLNISDPYYERKKRGRPRRQNGDSD